MAKPALIGQFIAGAPYTIDCEETLAAAEQVMSMHKIRHLPVLDGRRIFGIVSDRDLKLARAVRACKVEARPVLVREICLNKPYVVDEGESLESVASTMARRRIGCTIVTRGGAIGGIFTTTDACRLLAEFARKS